VSSDSLVIGDPAIGDLLMIELVILSARRAPSLNPTINR
jgi:hypothetical protein